MIMLSFFSFMIFDLLLTFIVHVLKKKKYYVQFNRRESISSTSSGDSGTPIDGIEGEYYTNVIQNKSFTVCYALFYFHLYIFYRH